MTWSQRCFRNEKSAKCKAGLFLCGIISSWIFCLCGCASLSRDVVLDENTRAVEGLTSGTGVVLKGALLCPEYKKEGFFLQIEGVYFKIIPKNLESFLTKVDSYKKDAAQPEVVVEGVLQIEAALPHGPEGGGAYPQITTGPGQPIPQRHLIRDAVFVEAQ